jgi:deoxynucleoside triphosphate triphosphohydrolase SAMHD1
LNQPDLEITQEMIQSVTIAGLCHNLGHGPFAYSFTDFVRDNLNISNWNHSTQSNLILDDIIDNNSIDISKEQINLIKDLIFGINGQNYNSNTDLCKNNFSFASTIKYPNWLFQILHNKTNSVDVDKFDFITRDTYKLGVQNQSIDYDILLNNTRIIDDNICYREKDAFSLYELFQCRYRLFKEFYLHRVSKGVDLMIKDIFAEADRVYNFKSYLEDPKLFVELKDSILTEIQYSDDSELDEAKAIIKRIYRRDLYKFVGEYICNSSSNSKEKFLFMKEEDIINSSNGNHGYLERNDIKIMKYNLNFGKGEEDPVSYVKFYDNKTYPYKSKKLEKTEISHMISNDNSEIIIRVYVKDSSKLKAAKDAFIKFCNEKAGESPNFYEKDSNRYAKSALKSGKKLFTKNETNGD